MKTVKVSEATGSVLDWLVAKCEGWKWRKCGGKYPITGYSPSTNWAQGGPIIEREKLGVFPSATPELGLWASGTEQFHATDTDSDEFWDAPEVQHGPTPLIAAMRCYCCAKPGEFVDIPEELCQQERS